MKNPFELTLAEWLAMTLAEWRAAHFEARRLAERTVARFLGGKPRLYFYVMLCATSDRIHCSGQDENDIPAIGEIAQFAIAQNRVPFEFYPDGSEFEAGWRLGQMVVTLNDLAIQSLKQTEEKK